MVALTFEVFHFSRTAEMVLDGTFRTESEITSCPNLVEVCNVLRFLYPRASGVRVTIQ